MDVLQNKIDKKDLNTFKIYVVIFAVTRLEIFVENQMESVFGNALGIIIAQLINYFGIGILIFGIYFLTKKYPKLSSGTRVVFWFLLLIIINFLRTIYFLLFPSPIATTQDINLLYNRIIYNSFASGTFAILIGIITFLSAYYFTKWFNDVFAHNNPTNAYLVYGIAYFLSSIVVVVGLYLFALLAVNTNPNIINSTSVEVLVFGLIILVVGIASLLVSIVAEFVACFKIYFRVNDMAIGKVSYNLYNPYYPNPYLPYNSYQPPNYQPPNYQPPNYQPPNFYDPNRNPNKPNDNASLPDNGVTSNRSNKYCAYCGTELRSESKFCPSCGQSVGSKPK